MKHVTRIHSGQPKPFAEVLAFMTGLSTDEVATLIRMGGAYLGKRRCKNADQSIRAGDRVSAYFRLPLVMNPIPFNARWVIEDRPHVLVACKPAGIPTQGRRDADYLAFYEILKANLRGYLGLHHRLDQETSGLMVFTRNRTYNKSMGQLFQEQRIEKTYLAVGTGEWPFPSRTVTIDQPIATRRQNKRTRHEVGRDGKQAQTHLSLVAHSEGLVMVRAKPKTGRTHQIRIHMAHSGMPLWGDTHYEGPSRPENAFFLHCQTLSWPAHENLPAGNFTALPPETWWSHLPQGWRAEILGEEPSC